jgi:hypothetical protein
MQSGIDMHLVAVLLTKHVVEQVVNRTRRLEIVSGSRLINAFAAYFVAGQTDVISPSTLELYENGQYFSRSRRPIG